MGGKVDVYVDCASLYSYFALVYLRKHRELLKQYDVEIEFHPFFLGGVNVATGNKPPGTVPAKAAYSSYDVRRGSEFFNTVPLSAPPFFPLFSVPPQRMMLAVKSLYPAEVFEKVYLDLWVWVYNRHIDINKPEVIRSLLRGCFGEKDIQKIMELSGSQHIKDQLTANTKYAVEKGAFGAPWLIMRNEKGEEEPIFGSDRWSYMFKFMGVEVRELEIVDRGQGTGGAKL